LNIIFSLIVSPRIEPLRKAFDGSGGMTAVRRMLIDAGTGRARNFFCDRRAALSKETDL
jgi:hypothetical protein